MTHPFKRFRSTGITAALLASVLTAPSVFANTGTVTINGAVTATTCTVNVNGGTSPGTVILPTVSASLLSSSGNTAGATPFSIGVTACSAGATKMDIHFTSGFNASGRLSNGAAPGGAANNVEVQLLRADQSVIAGNASYGSQYTNQSTGSTYAATLAGNAATQNFIAQYRSNGSATAGAFSASFNFTVVYY